MVMIGEKEDILSNLKMIDINDLKYEYENQEGDEKCTIIHYAAGRYYLIIY